MQNDGAQAQRRAGREVPGEARQWNGLSAAKQPRDAAPAPVAPPLHSTLFCSEEEGDLTALLLLLRNPCPSQGVKLGEEAAPALLLPPQPTEQTGQGDVLTNVLYCKFSTIIKDFVELN